MSTHPESALKTYIKATAWMLPFAAAWIFCAVFLMPRVEGIWIESGAHASLLSKIISVSSVSLNQGRAIIAVLVLTCVCFEIWAHWWPARRKMAIEIITFLFTLSVLLMILGASTAAVALAGIK